MNQEKQGVSIKQILREKEMADSISEKCDLVLQQHHSLQELTATLSAKDQEIEALREENEKLKKAIVDATSGKAIKGKTGGVDVS